jgi:hypothetical protein
MAQQTAMQEAISHYEKLSERGSDQAWLIAEYLKENFLPLEEQQLRIAFTDGRWSNDFFKKADDDINEQEILEQAAATNVDKVKAVRDYSGHWYIIPNELYQNFLKDLDNEDMVDSGKFSEKYGKYMTGGDLNLVQLYANI